MTPSTPYGLSASTAGTCLVTATKAGDAIYEPVSSAPTTLTFAARPVDPVDPVGPVVPVVPSGPADPSPSPSPSPAPSPTPSPTPAAPSTGTPPADPGTATGPTTPPGTAPGTAAQAPGKVTKLKVAGKPTKGRRKVTWTMSAGGARATSYQVTVRKGRTEVLSKTVTKPQVTLKRSKLPRGGLKVSVTSLNAVGAGKPTSASFKVR